MRESSGNIGRRDYATKPIAMRPGGACFRTRRCVMRGGRLPGTQPDPWDGAERPQLRGTPDLYRWRADRPAQPKDLWKQIDEGIDPTEEEIDPTRDEEMPPGGDSR